MHYAAIHWNKRFQKLGKVKAKFFFWILIQIWSFQFWLVTECTNIEGKISPSDICKIWGVNWQKTCWGYRTDFKFCTQKLYLVLKKIPQNNLFVRGPHDGENGIWNIWIFAAFFVLSKYLMCCSEAGVHSSPQFQSPLACRLLRLSLIFGWFSCSRRLCSTRIQINIQKWICAASNLQIFCLK